VASDAHVRVVPMSLVEAMTMGHGGARGEAHKSATLTNAQVIEMRDLHVKGTTVRELAVKYNTQDTTVRRVLTGQTWASVTGGTNVLRRVRQGAYRAGNARLTRKQVETLREYAKLYPTIPYRAWAGVMGVSDQAVFDILHGWTYKDGEQP
jgi:hypothetical protein